MGVGRWRLQVLLKRSWRGIGALGVGVVVALAPLALPWPVAAADAPAEVAIVPGATAASLQAPRVFADAISPVVASGLARKVGRLPPGRVLRLAFVLQPRHSVALLALAGERQRVDGARYAAEFTPAPAAVETVVGFAAGAGLQVLQRFPDLVLVQGTAGQVAAALHVTLNTYRTGARSFYATADAPVVPAAVGDVLAGIVGLNGVPYTAGPATVIDPGATSNFTPDAVRTAYGFMPAYGNGIDGTGRNIAVIMSGDFSPADVQTFSQTFGLPYAAPRIRRVPVPGTPAPLGVDAESTLDVEWAHALAPGATITEYESGDLQEADLLAAFDMALQAQPVPDAINLSFGAPDLFVSAADAAAWHDLFAQAVAKGSTPVAASGDFGAFVAVGGYAFETPSHPASDPLTLAVGGTQLTLTAANTRATESAYQGPGPWQPGVTQGSGGGCSIVFADLTGNEPPTAQGTCPGGFRAVPDVSMLSQDVELYTGGGGWRVANGTSFAAPMWAGIIALAAQKAGHGFGWIRPTINGLAADHGAFQDVTGGFDGVFAAGPGWDAVTGWGSPGNGWTLIQDLATAAVDPGAAGPRIAGVVVAGQAFLTDQLIANGVATVDVIGSGFGASQGAGTVTLAGGGHSYAVPVTAWAESDITLNTDGCAQGCTGLFQMATPPAGTYTLTVAQGGGSGAATVHLADFLTVHDAGPTPVVPVGAPLAPTDGQRVDIAVYTPAGQPDGTFDGTVALAVLTPPTFSGALAQTTVWQNGQILSPGPAGTYAVAVTAGTAEVRVATTGATTSGAAVSYEVTAPGLVLGYENGGRFSYLTTGLSLHSPEFVPTYESVYQDDAVPLELLDPYGNLAPAADTLSATITGTVAGNVYLKDALVHSATGGASTSIPLTLATTAGGTPFPGIATLLIRDDTPETLTLSVYDTSQPGVGALTLPLPFTAAAGVALQSPTTVGAGAQQVLQVTVQDRRGAETPFPGSGYLALSGGDGREGVSQQVSGTWAPLAAGPLGYPLDLTHGAATVAVTSPAAGTLTYQASLQFGGATALSSRVQGVFLPGAAASLAAGFILPHMATSAAAAPQYSPAQVFGIDAYGNVAALADTLDLLQAPGGPAVSVAVPDGAGGWRVVGGADGPGGLALRASTPCPFAVASMQTGTASFALTDATHPGVAPATLTVVFVNSVPTGLGVAAPVVPPGAPQGVTVRVLDQNGQPVVNDADQVALSIGAHTGVLSVTDTLGRAVVADGQGRYLLNASAGVVTFEVTDSAAEVLDYALVDVTAPVVAPGSARGVFARGLAVATAALPAATLGSAYAGSLQAAGGVPPYTWALESGALPTGLTLDPGGTITGTPSVAGTSTVTVAVTDATGAQATGTLSLTVAAPAGGSGGGGGGGGGGSHNAPAPVVNQPVLQTGTAVEETVDTAAGGVVVSTAGGGAQLALPAGAFGAKVTLQVTVVAGAPPAPAGDTLLSPVWRFDAGGAELLRPATVTFRIAALPAGVAPGQLALYTLGGTTWTFVTLAQPAATPGEVTATLPHLSDWAVMALTTTFGDVPVTHWAFPAVEELVARGAIAGYPDGSFRPSALVSRAEFVKMLDLSLGIAPVLGQAQPFADVAVGAWYAPYFTAASGAGLILGADGLARPEAPVTREEAAVVVSRALAPAAVVAEPAGGGFTDGATIAPWALAAVQTDVSQGLLRGYGDGTFRPRGQLARDEAAALLVRLIHGRHA